MSPFETSRTEKMSRASDSDTDSDLGIVPRKKKTKTNPKTKIKTKMKTKIKTKIKTRKKRRTEVELLEYRSWY